ncbi:hypothetical protein J6590_054479 [Homalodisca vitripennis]|nr:hypothetical protein J6590_054479 [Homalodisca vitripennis]
MALCPALSPVKNDRHFVVATVVFWSFLPFVVNILWFCLGKETTTGSPIARTKSGLLRHRYRPAPGVPDGGFGTGSVDSDLVEQGRWEKSGSQNQSAMKGGERGAEIERGLLSKTADGFRRIDDLRQSLSAN